MIRSCVEEITLGNYAHYTVRGCPGPDSGFISDSLDEQRDILVQLEKSLQPGECTRLLGCHLKFAEMDDPDTCVNDLDIWTVLLEATG